MSTTFHTAIATGAAANASMFNTPLGDLDAAISTMTKGYGASAAADDASHATSNWVSIGAGVVAALAAGSYLLFGVVTVIAGTTAGDRMARLVNLVGGDVHAVGVKRFAAGETGQIIVPPALVAISPGNQVELQFWAVDANDTVNGDASEVESGFVAVRVTP